MRKKWISRLLIAATLFAAFWLYAGDLYTSPKEVARSRTRYTKLLTSYRKNREEWDTRQVAFLAQIGKGPLETKLPFEILISYLVNHLGFSEGEFSHVALFPKSHPSEISFYLSKYESGWRPMRIVLSLEIKLVQEGGRWRAKLVEFRRGQRPMATGLAWIYLNAELQRLRSFESFAELLPHLSLEESEESEILLCCK